MKTEKYHNAAARMFARRLPVTCTRLIGLALACGWLGASGWLGGQMAWAQTDPAPPDQPVDQAVDPNRAETSGDDSDSDPTAGLTEDEIAVWTKIESFVDAFNRGDAEGLAKHWLPTGESIAPDGTAAAGREALQQEFTQFFSDNPGVKIELLQPTVVLLSPHVAVEKGMARVVAPEAEPKETEYEAVHVKTADGWLLDSVREKEPASVSSNYQRLTGLEWMIGSWSDVAGGEETLTAQCRWTRNQNFIARSFQVFTPEGVTFEGTEVIGWDPINETVRSWVFDSDGGFGVGRWSQAENRWTVESLQTTPDGKRASATFTYDVLDDGSVVFRAVGRQVDGELLPNVGPVTLQRTGAAE